MTIPRVLIAVGLGFALYFLGANTDRWRTSQIVRSARAAWHPESKRDRRRLHRNARRNAKRVTRAVYR